MYISFNVPGKPRSKQSTNFTAKTPSGKDRVMSYTSQETRDYASLIRDCYWKMYGDEDKILGCVALGMVIYFGIPKHTSKVKREKMLRGEIRPAKIPDTGNILKAIEDALKNIAFEDDKFIVDHILAKRYAPDWSVGITISKAKGVDG